MIDIAKNRVERLGWLGASFERGIHAFPALTIRLERNEWHEDPAETATSPLAFWIDQDCDLTR